MGVLFQASDLIQQCRDRTAQTGPLNAVALDFKKVAVAGFSLRKASEKRPLAEHVATMAFLPISCHLQAHSLSLPFFQVALKASFRLAEPIQWKGGALHAIWKRKRAS